MMRYLNFKANPDQLSNHSFSTLTLQREACSSREAVYYTLKKMKEKYENPSPYLFSNA